MVSNGAEGMVSATARLNAMLEKPREAERRGMRMRGGLVSGSGALCSAEITGEEREEWSEEVSVIKERMVVMDMDACPNKDNVWVDVLPPPLSTRLDVCPRLYHHPTRYACVERTVE